MEFLTTRKWRKFGRTVQTIALTVFLQVLVYLLLLKKCSLSVGLPLPYLRIYPISWFRNVRLISNGYLLTESIANVSVPQGFVVRPRLVLINDITEPFIFRWQSKTCCYKKSNSKAEVVIPSRMESEPIQKKSSIYSTCPFWRRWKWDKSKANAAFHSPKQLKKKTFLHLYTSLVSPHP